MKQVAAAVIVSEGKILAAKRKKERVGGGFWEFPGGKVELGETAKDACQREVKEELGDECQVYERLPVKREYQTPYGDLTIDFFWTKLLTKNLRLVAASEYRWLKPTELAEVEWLEASKEALELIRQTDLEKVISNGK